MEDKPNVFGLPLGQVANVIDALEHRHLSVSRSQCTRARHRSSTCARCVEACPVAAINLSNCPQIDLDACLGCGICASVCPTGALEARSPASDELMVQAQFSGYLANSFKVTFRFTYGFNTFPFNKDEAILTALDVGADILFLEFGIDWQNYV